MEEIKNEIVETNEELQTVFNEDGLELLVEDGTIENKEEATE